MRALARRALALSLIATLAVATASPSVELSGTPAYAQSGGPCGLGQAAFCDTFDQPHLGGARSGHLDPSRWSVSRITGKNNQAQGYVNQFIPTQAMRCRDHISGVLPPNDFFFCGPEFGESMHWMEAFDDGDNYAYNSARIRQPFDFTGRTGTVVWDVDAKTSGPHGWWLEVWITDEPMTAPHHKIIDTPLPRNGIGLDFAHICGTPIRPGDIGSVESSLLNVKLVRNHTVTGEVLPWQGSGGPTMQHRDCYTTGPDMHNHFKLLLNQQRLELWSTDAQGTRTLAQRIHRN